MRFALFVAAIAAGYPPAAFGQQAFGPVTSLAARPGTPAAVQPLGVRLKDLVVVQGVRDNALLGYGIVTGLNGTGDGTIVSRQLLANLLERLHLTANRVALNSKNIAAVMVSAELPPFAKEGSTIDVIVSSLGDAKSLAGGVLHFTPIYGADGQVYAIAQGPISTGGFAFAGAGGQTQKNHPQVGRIPNGAKIELEPEVRMLHRGVMLLTLRQPDFTTAERVAEALNQTHPDMATALDAASVRVQVPEPLRTEDNIVRFIASIEDTMVVPDAVARVVINERTGTIVAGTHVRIHRVAVSHGDLTLTISENPEVSQPNAFGQGDTVVTERTTIEARETPARLFVLEEGVSVDIIARALNALGVSPRDMICIFQALKAAGALHAELVIM